MRRRRPAPRGAARAASACASWNSTIDGSVESARLMSAKTGARRQSAPQQSAKLPTHADELMSTIDVMPMPPRLTGSRICIAAASISAAVAALYVVRGVGLLGADRAHLPAEREDGVRAEARAERQKGGGPHVHRPRAFGPGSTSALSHTACPLA